MQYWLQVQSHQTFSEKKQTRSLPTFSLQQACCTKKNQVPLCTTIAATIQRIFHGMPSIGLFLGLFLQRRDKTTRQIARKLVNAAVLYHKRFIFVHVTVNANMLASYDWYLYVVNIFQKIVERWKLFNGNFCFSDRGRLQCWYAYTTKPSSLCHLQVHIFRKNLSSGCSNHALS